MRKFFIKAGLCGLGMLCVSQSVLAACAYKVSSEWDAGLIGEITVTNNGSSAVNGWNVGWQYANNRMNGSWNATIAGSNPYTATNLSWNGNLQPGQSATFGVQVEKNGGSAEVPTITGSLCNGAASSSAQVNSSRPSLSAPSSIASSTRSSLASSVLSSPSITSSPKSSSSFSSLGSPIFTNIQENASGFCGVGGSIDSNHAGHTGSGFVNTTNAVGTGVTYSVTVDNTSYAMFDVRFGSINNRPGNILVNGSVVGHLNFVSTGAWTSWTTESITVPLSAGVNTIRIVSTTDGGLPNIDSLTLVGNGIKPATCDTNPGDVKNPPVKSVGCGKALSLQDGRRVITSNGVERAYHIRLPRNYDATTPYRLFYVSHGLGGMSEDVYGFLDWFGLKPEADRANVPAIWIAPSVPSRGNPWTEADHPLFDNITNFAKANLCVDTSRIFVAGMSFGGMISYSLSTNHQTVIRAGFGMAPANFNIWLPNPKRTDPIAWMQTTGMSDGTTPWDGGNGRGAEYIALEKARDNGCNVPSSIETWRPGNPSDHLCVDMQNCNKNYPVKVCTFDGGHIHDPRDRGSSTSWVPGEAWKFFMQF